MSVSVQMTLYSMWQSEQVFTTRLETNAPKGAKLADHDSLPFQFNVQRQSGLMRSHFFVLMKSPNGLTSQEWKLIVAKQADRNDLF